jgi:hypothetical protein
MPAPCGGTIRDEPLTLGRVLRIALAQRPAPRLSALQWKILHALCACRTPKLGGHHYLCLACGHRHFVAHACRNRHCPSCQGLAAHQWMEAQKKHLLPVPYFHVVFTLPHELNGLIRQNQRALFSLLFSAASETLLAFGENRFGVQVGVTAILHTWGQTLCEHYHLHCLVAGGGLSADGQQWVGTPPHFLFPVRALSKVFCGKFCHGLKELQQAGKLEFHGQMEALNQEKAFQGLLRQATRQKWVVYAKRPFAGPKQVLAYLSRYTHRVAIGNGRLQAFDPLQKRVSFFYKDYADGEKRKVMTLGLDEFVRRYSLHLLPERFVKIRHYGLLGNRGKEKRIARARELLAIRSVSSQAAVEGRLSVGQREPHLPTCPRCGVRKLLRTGVVAPTPKPDWEDSS